MKTELVPQFIIDNFYTEFQENLLNCSVAATKSRTGRQRQTLAGGYTGVISTAKWSFFLICKQHLNRLT
jgi:hypothetical protein